MNILRAMLGPTDSPGGRPTALRCSEDGALLTESVGGAGGTTVPVDVFGNPASNTITAAGVSQQILNSNSGRQILILQNPSTETEPLYYNFGSAADIEGTSPELAPGQTALFDIAVPTTTVHVIAATMGHRFYAKEGPVEL